MQILWKTVEKMHQEGNLTQYGKAQSSFATQKQEVPVDMSSGKIPSTQSHPLHTVEKEYYV